MFAFLRAGEKIAERLLTAHAPAVAKPTIPQPSYYMWTGIGAIESLDGDDGPEALDRFAAIQALRAKQYDTAHDWTLWERLGDQVRLVAAIATDPETSERGVINFLL